MTRARYGNRQRDLFFLVKESLDSFMVRSRTFAVVLPVGGIWGQISMRLILPRRTVIKLAAAVVGF